MNYTIRETSKLTGLPESTLRYYETIGLLQPINRDPSSKHRIYDESNINFAIAVACLSATGMSIQDMRTYLLNRNRGALASDEQITLLHNQQQRLVEESRFLELQQRYIECKINYWHAVKSGDADQIESTRKQAFTIAQELKRGK